MFNQCHPIAFCLLQVVLLVQASEEECNKRGLRGTCGDVASVKGLIFMLESVSGAMADIISSAKYRTETIEEELCLNRKLINGSTAIIDDDHCVKAQLDCSGLQRLGFVQSGLYRIWPRFLNHSLHVYCDMDTDGGGWTLIQRRGDFGEPHISFYETWETYKNAFGNLKEEFWLGNDVIFALTNQDKTILRIDLEDFDGEKRFAKYQNFLVRSELENYKMTLGKYNGNAGDALTTHNNQEFSTKDHGGDCAKIFKGGWWYADCHESNLNGIYHHGQHSSYADGINWLHFRGHNHSMKSVEMKIRPCNC